MRLRLVSGRLGLSQKTVPSLSVRVGVPSESAATCFERNMRRAPAIWSSGRRLASLTGSTMVSLCPVCVQSDPEDWKVYWSKLESNLSPKMFVLCFQPEYLQPNEIQIPRPRPGGHHLRRSQHHKNRVLPFLHCGAVGSVGSSSGPARFQR